MREESTDVLVVGVGPSGITAVLSLATQGVKVIGISRHRGTAHTPRAHITNQRTMEVFRDLGVEDGVQAVGWPLSYLSHNVISTTLSGQEIARYKSYGTGFDRRSDYAAASPCASINAPQHVMEPVLLDAARERGADVRYYHELVSIEQSQDEVVALIRVRDSGEEYRIKAKYAIGADGARSRVAEHLGFSFKGEAGLRGMANSWVETDLTEYCAHRPGVIFSVMRPGHNPWQGTGSLVNVRPWNEWSLLHPWDTSKGLPSEEQVIAHARLLIGDPDHPVKVKTITTWQVNNVVANEYRKGRVFLAGDAAHRHPPTGGLGTNTSVQDSYNLAWKLAMVLSGKAGAGLLDSYEQERQPVGAHVVERAITSFFNMNQLFAALGFKQGQSEEEDWATIAELTAPTARGAERRVALDAALKLQDYRSNAIGVELGQHYASSAVVDDGTDFPVPARDPELYYHPTTHPGAFIPHAWIEIDGKQVSTVDLVRHNRFSLIVGLGGDGWERAAASLAKELGIDLAVFRIGPRCPCDDVTRDWYEVRVIDDHGALLVRPDGYIGWRAMTGSDDPETALGNALRQILDRAAG